MTKSEREIYELRLDNLDRVIASMTTELSTYKEVISAVRKMRKAQKRQEYTDSTLDREAMSACRKLTKQRESEVDEYLKKMEE